MDAEPLMNRRQTLKLGAGLFGGLAGLGALPTPGLARIPSQPISPWAKKPAESCIIIWLDGGPSHIDTFDMKPDAPSDYRGEFSPISSSLDGLQICEHLPQLASQMHHTALVRSLTSVEGNHDRGSHLYQTGHSLAPALTYPSLGSALSRLRPSAAGPLPSYISLGGVPWYGGSGYLSSRYNPYAPGSEEGLQVSAQERERILRRRQLLQRVDQLGTGGKQDARSTFIDEGVALLTDPRALEAFEIEREPQAVRDRYGTHTLGRHLLLARRLTEAGSRCVTVVDPHWDTHENHFRRMTKEGYPPQLVALDQSLSGLLADLHQRGTLEQTLVVVMGEMGRTPKINTKAGRDHWPRANFSLLAGGGLRTGQVIGATDARGELPIERPLDPMSLVATLYKRMGVDTDQTLTSPDGRTVRLLDDVPAIDELL